MKAAVYCATRNVYEDVIPSIKSLLFNSDVEKIYILAEDDELPFYLPPECEVVNVSDQRYFPKGGLNYNTKWTYIILMRLVLARLFPDLDRILSMDNDTIVVDDISELWDIDLTGYYFAAVKEPYRSGLINSLYTCIGVALFNLDMMREYGMTTRFVRELNSRIHPYPEQDVLNSVCKGNIKELLPMYGMSPWTTQCDNPKIEHFAASEGKWRIYDIVKKYRDIPWEEIEKKRKERDYEDTDSSPDV